MKCLLKGVVSLATSAALLTAGLISVNTMAESKYILGYLMLRQKGNNCWAYVIRVC